MKQMGLLEVWQPAPAKMNWSCLSEFSKMKKTRQKNRGSKITNIATGKFVSRKTATSHFRNISPEVQLFKAVFISQKRRFGFRLNPARSILRRRIQRTRQPLVALHWASVPMLTSLPRRALTQVSLQDSRSPGTTRDFALCPFSASQSSLSPIAFLSFLNTKMSSCLSC